MQKLFKHKLLFVDNDTADKELKGGAARYLKNYRLSINKNLTGDEGGNQGVGTPIPSNAILIEIPLPAGINKTCGGGEFEETNEYYFCNWNSNGDHGLYKINGDTLTCDTVIIDPLLNFSTDPKHYITKDRMTLRVFYVTDSSGNKVVFEKHWMGTDGLNWQRWINIEAAIATKGFNETLFPYYKVQYPHFDRNELIEYATRPSEFPPVLSEIPYTESDSTKDNHLLEQSVQLAIRYIYTDGRPTALSAYSDPYFQTKTSCSLDNKGKTRCLNVGIYAGGPHVEKIQVLKRNCNGDFVLYDTIEKYSTCDENGPALIGTKYWLRTNPFEDYDYNSITNTITYTYCGDKECTPFDNTPTGDTYFQTSLPIKSMAMADAGDAIVFGNNLKGYNNLDCETLKNIKINIAESADTGDSCTVKNVKITAYAYIRENRVTNQLVWIANADQYQFGGLQYIPIAPAPNFPVAYLDHIDYSQTEVDKFNLKLGNKEGFIGYLAGTGYYAIGKQCAVDASGNITEIGPINAADNSRKQAVVDNIKAGGYYVQKFEFNVPQGTYAFRIAGHGASVDSEYELTSTYVMGKVNHTAITDAKSQFPMQDIAKEFIINACNGDVDMWESGDMDVLTIFTPFTSDNSEWRFIDGYFSESSESTIGMEFAAYNIDRGQNNLRINGTITDHNGFFWAYGARDEADKGEVRFGMFINCQLRADSGAHTSINQPNVSGAFLNQNIQWSTFNGGTFGDQNRVLIKGTITDCDSGAPLSGIAVTFPNSKTYFSDGEGNYTVVIHPGIDPNRTGDMLFNSGSCPVRSCDCACIAPSNISITGIPCNSGQPRNYPTSVDRQFKVVAENNKGLKGGGRYGFYVVGSDAAKRATFANLVDYKDIPTFMQSQVYTPYALSWELTGPLNLPPEIKSLSFYRTKNLNFRSYIQWVGDKIEFFDSNGELVEDGIGAIRARVTIASLLEFNKENNFSTTVNYQFEKGDIVRFYDNGNGVLFTPDVQKGYMDYQVLGSNFNDTVQGERSIAQTDGDTTTTTTTPITESDGKSFIIAFDSRLLALVDKCGFWIELIKPNDCTDIELVCQINAEYPVQNGELMFGITSGPLNTWDTYYHNRTIKIKDCSNTTFLHPFESSSISDFWGENCGSCGRITVQDKEAKQYWDLTEVQKSDEWDNTGRINGLGVFRGKRSTFPGQKRGGIVAMYIGTGLMAFICENDVFMTSYNQKYVQANSSGFITVNLDQIIGTPQPKPEVTHGCDMDDRASLVFEKDLAFYFDRKNAAMIAFPYSSPIDISGENKSYFINKATQLINFNKSLLPADRLNNLIEVCAGYNPLINGIELTFRPRKGLSPSLQNFVNNEREVKIQMNETFVYNINQKKWSSYMAYTPEYYGVLRASISGKEMITHVNGICYFHNSILPKSASSYNIFYGIKTDTILEYVVSGVEEGLDDKEKVFQSIAIKSNGDAFFVDKIVTDKKKPYSYIPIAYFKKVNNVWYASILADANTYPDPSHPVESQLIDGNQMNGLYAKIRLVKDTANNDKYFELDKILTRFCGIGHSDK